jgi:hypothetical protein
MTQLRYVGSKTDGPNTRINHVNPRIPPINAVPYAEITVDRSCRCRWFTCAWEVVSRVAKRLGERGISTGSVE